MDLLISSVAEINTAGITAEAEEKEIKLTKNFKLPREKVDKMEVEGEEEEEEEVEEEEEDLDEREVQKLISG